MANALAPFGFRPIRHLGGTGHRTNQYLLKSDLSDSLFEGDLVKSDGSGGIQLCGRGEAMLGVFMGWWIPTQNALGNSNYGGNIGAQIPHSKMWVPGTTLPSGMNAYALVLDDPNETFRVQCLHTLTMDHIGALVNLEPGVSGNSLYQRSSHGVSGIVTGGPISSVTVGGSGTSYVDGNAITVTRHASDPWAVGGTTAAGTIAVTTGNITGVTVTAGGFYSASHLPTITAPTGSGNTLTAVVGSPIAMSQFRVERILEFPGRKVDSNNNTTGYGLSETGSYCYVEVKPVKHERLGSAGAVAA